MGGGGWEAGGGLHRPTGLFGVAMSRRSASHRPMQTRLEGLKRRLTNTGVDHIKTRVKDEIMRKIILINIHNLWKRNVYKTYFLP